MGDIASDVAYTAAIVMSLMRVMASDGVVVYTAAIVMSLMRVMASDGVVVYTAATVLPLMGGGHGKHGQ